MSQYTVRTYGGQVIGHRSWLADAIELATDQARERRELVGVVMSGSGAVAHVDPLGAVERAGESCPQCKGQGHMFYTPSGMFFSFPPPMEKRDCDVCRGTGLARRGD